MVIFYPNEISSLLPSLRVLCVGGMSCMWPGRGSTQADAHYDASLL